ncbi:MAG: serine/threonine-protein kinase [Saprospiraceae bacterium]
MIGRKLSNFHINERIGEGGMGTVYKATDLHLNRTVAIKMLHPFLVNNPDSFRRFQNEAQLSARISHPNVATLFNFTASDDTHFIVMEYVDGQALDDVLKLQGKLPENEAAKVILQVLEGLGAAHDLGIMHRDLKPGNIMITQRGFVKLMDFGIARLEHTERMTRQNSVIGTLEYLSPELVKGGPPSKASDLYAVGVMFYEMLAGKSLYTGETEAAVMYQIAHEQANIRLDGVNKRLLKIIKKLTHKDVNKRYQSTQAVIKDLEEIFQGGKVNTRLMAEKLEPVAAHQSAPISLPIQVKLPDWNRFKGVKLPIDIDLRILAGALVLCLFIIILGRRQSTGTDEGLSQKEMADNSIPAAAAELDQPSTGQAMIPAEQLSEPKKSTIQFIEKFEENAPTPKKVEEKTRSQKGAEQPKEKPTQKNENTAAPEKKISGNKEAKDQSSVASKDQTLAKDVVQKGGTIASIEEKPQEEILTPTKLDLPVSNTPKRRAEPLTIRIPDMFLSATFTETVSTEKNYEGQDVYLSASYDIYQGEHLIVPKGAKVKAVVKKLRKAEGNKNAFLAINLLAVQAINGNWLTINYPEYSNLSKTAVEFQRGSQLNRIKLKSTNITLNN